MLGKVIMNAYGLQSLQMIRRSVSESTVQISLLLWFCAANCAHCKLWHVQRSCSIGAKSEGDELMHLGGPGMRLCASIHEPEKLACGTLFTDTNNSRIANSAQYCGQMLHVYLCLVKQNTFSFGIWYCWLQFVVYLCH